ncbi:hypothetical protein Y032_0041g406 [Ancylostoma ceylanicum]|uniref:Uncharacterized protein n=1 Tax=Ancylostoma ceylanicum TaxID=53326 RepID=A0A016UH23_9BILA|nr:hypothetical protein Y032_0041g406 [Ancylostoma ceylanicum]
MCQSFTVQDLVTLSTVTFPPLNLICYCPFREEQTLEQAEGGIRSGSVGPQKTPASNLRHFEPPIREF